MLRIAKEQRQFSRIPEIETLGEREGPLDL